MGAGEGGQAGLRLKAREKVLVQLYLHRCEPDDLVFPFEVTQKGLSDHLGLRRSHVAVALQELAKDGLVECVKGHVEGADRRQNAYCVTAKGADAASSVRQQLFEVEVTFEDSGGTRTLKVSEIVTARKASLASVISQMDRGGPVRDEIAVMASPAKRLVSVFCPTCKKQIEVDNLSLEDEVGFDCPGCGRPYRIVSAVRKEEAGERMPAPARPWWSGASVPMVAASVALLLYLWLEDIPCLMFLALLTVGLGVAVWALMRGRGRRARKPARPPSRVRAVFYTLALSPVLIAVWHFTVAEVDTEETFATLAPIIGALILAYVAVHAYRPEFRGDFLLSSGILLMLVAAATMVLVDFGEVEVGMALIVGMAGAVMVVLATFHPMDRDAVVLDASAAVGAFLLLLTGTELVWECSEAIDWIATGSVALLGAALLWIRAARERTGSKELSTHLVAALPVTLAAGLAVYGLFLLDGGAVMTGALELAVAVPFAYYGARQVLNEHWPYRVPLVAFFLAVLAFVFTATLVT